MLTVRNVCDMPFTHSPLPIVDIACVSEGATAVALVGVLSGATRIVRQPAAMPASTSDSESPMIHERFRSRSRSRAALRSIPGRGFRQLHASVVSCGQ